MRALLFDRDITLVGCQPLGDHRGSAPLALGCRGPVERRKFADHLAGQRVECFFCSCCHSQRLRFRR